MIIPFALEESLIFSLLDEFIHLFFFFFQAEDGIRFLTVTGVQTCALPILRGWPAVSTTVPRSVSPPASNDVRSAAMVRVTTCLPGNNERLAAYPTEGHVASRPENTWGRPNECGRARLCANYALNPCRTGGRA